MGWNVTAARRCGSTPPAACAATRSRRDSLAGNLCLSARSQPDRRLGGSDRDHSPHRLSGRALAHLRQQAESKPVKEAVAALVEFKRGRVGEIRFRTFKTGWDDSPRLAEKRLLPKSPRTKSTLSLPGFPCSTVTPGYQQKAVRRYSQHDERPEMMIFRLSAKRTFFFHR